MSVLINKITIGAQNLKCYYIKTFKKQNIFKVYKSPKVFNFFENVIKSVNKYGLYLVRILSF